MCHSWSGKPERRSLLCVVVSVGLHVNIIWQRHSKFTLTINHKVPDTKGQNVFSPAFPLLLDVLLCFSYAGLYFLPHKLCMVWAKNWCFAQLQPLIRRHFCTFDSGLRLAWIKSWHWNHTLHFSGLKNYIYIYFFFSVLEVWMPSIESTSRDIKI